MRHHSGKRKFGREKDQRNALMKGLVVSLVRDEKIQTTAAKAKELRPMMEKLITKGKPGTLAARKLLISRTGSTSTAKKIVEVLAPKYKARAGGYTRITKMGNRLKDAAPLAMIEFV